MNTHTRHLRGRLVRALALAALVLLLPLPAMAQDAVSPGAVRPGTERPQDAVHGGVPSPAPSSMPGGAGMPQRKPFTLKVAVQKVGADGKKAPVPGASVLVDAIAGQMKITSYTATSDANGVATFELNGVSGANYVPKVVHEGINFTGASVSPTQDVHEVAIDLFDKSFDDKNLLVTDMMTTVDLWEDYLVFTQMWTFVNAAPVAFDPTGAGERYAEGLPIVLPKMAQGINAMVIRGQGVTEEGRVVENRVLVNAPVPPMAEGQDPLRVQLRYSIPMNASTMEYRQELEYKIEGMRVVVPLQTRYKRHPRLNLELTAPGFPEVGKGNRMPGMRADLDFVVARDGHAEPGGELYFTISGLPIPEPTKRNIALGLGLLVLLGGGLLLGRERKGDSLKGKGASKALMRALTEEREDLFDALRDLEDRYEDGELSDRLYDIEAARLRERLALVLRRLDQERGVSSSRKGAA